MAFLDRREAGRRLARHLEEYRGTDAIVLGVPRGGVPVAYEVATALDLPLDVLIVRKVGAPFQPELGLGAVAEGGAQFLDQRLIAEVGATNAEVMAIVELQRREIERRGRLFRQGRPPPDLTNRTVLVVDDGIATGGTVRAGLRALRTLRPRKIVLAVPVAPADTLRKLEGEADAIVCVEPLHMLWSVGEHYQDFTQTEDSEVARLLEEARGVERRAPL
jgi:putative phosphoribosyl transferase